MPFRSIMPWMKPELRAFGNGEIIACQDVSPTMGGLECSRGGTAVLPWWDWRCCTLCEVYQMVTRFALGTNIGSDSVMPKASYQASMWGI